MQTDEELIGLVANDDARAFDELYQRHKNGLLWYIKRKTGTARGVEDISQQTWTSVWRNRKRFESGRVRFFTWLTKIAYREITTAARRDRRHKIKMERLREDALNHPEADLVDCVETRLMDCERQDEQMTYLEAAAMQRGVREVRLVGLLLQGKTYREIGEELSINHQRVGQLVDRLRKEAKILVGTRQEVCAGL